MTKKIAFLFSNIAKAELFAFLNLGLLWFWLLEFLTGRELLKPAENFSGLLGFFCKVYPEYLTNFISYLMPMFLGALLLDGVRHKNGALCKLWLIYQLVVLMGGGILLFISDTPISLSSRSIAINICTVFFKTIGAFVVLDFLREIDYDDYTATVMV